MCGEGKGFGVYIHVICSTLTPTLKPVISFTYVCRKPNIISNVLLLPHSIVASQVSDDAQEADVDDAIESLQSDDPTLTKLNLNNHTRLDPALISQLVEALHGNTHLKTLSLANIRFSEDHAKQLADVLRVNTSLTVLNLESNRITRKGIAAIMKALAENKETVLSELRLANQYFSGGAGAESDIAKHLEKVTSIIRLGYNFTSPSIRTRIDRYIMRNTDLIRQKRASLVV
jgi:Ran GTPase-activating protein (RanGAP) involved in mRNA processing and transport